MGKIMSKISQKKKSEIISSILLLAVFVLPVLVLAGQDKKIYVDANASGAENGSSEHPYKTIGKALDKSDDDTEIHIAAGVYKENIEIPKGVEIYGSDREDVIIQGKNDDKPVVEMKNKTKINKVTIKKGKHGIKVKEDSKVSIIKCVIKDNDKDGIRISGGKADKKKEVSITNSVIKNNGRTGIFSETRRIVIMDNEIIDNESDGIDLAAGTSAWIQENTIKNNDGSGMKLTLDSSNIWTKNNTYYGNEREGVEVNGFGKVGRIDLNKSKFYKNERYGVARVQRGNFSASIWNGFTVQSNSKYWLNKIGDLSRIIRIF